MTHFNICIQHGSELRVWLNTAPAAPVAGPALRGVGTYSNLPNVVAND